MKQGNKLQFYWGYRGFVVSSIRRDFQLRYNRSLLGVAWLVLKPASMILVYTLIFSKIMGSRVGGDEYRYSYSIYLCSGILIWNLFSDITLQVQGCFTENSNLIKKIIFPRLCLPIIAVGTALINFTIIFSLFLIFLMLSNNFPGIVILSIIPLLALLVAMAAGLGLAIAVVNVFFRDVSQLFGVWIQIWFWLTPIVYVLKDLPNYVQLIVLWNPLTPIVAGFHNIFTLGIGPKWVDLWYPATVAISFLILGLLLFKNHNAEMVDEL